MPYLNVEDAIRRKFESFADVNMGRAPTDFEARGQSGLGDSQVARLRFGEKSLRVPVLEWDKQGALVDVWPAITYRLQGEEPRFSNYYYADTLVYDCVGISYQHDAVSEEERSGPAIISLRETPDPVTLMYELRVWALSSLDAKLLLEALKKIFPMTGFLAIRERDGRESTIDMRRTEGPTWVGGEDPTLPEGDPGHRFWCWAITYEIEAYDDNSLETTLHPTIERRLVEETSVDETFELEVVDSDRYGRPD